MLGEVFFGVLDVNFQGCNLNNDYPKNLATEIKHQPTSFFPHGLNYIHGYT